MKRVQYIQNSNVYASNVDNQLVVVDLEKEKIYFFNSTAESIWNIFRSKKTIEKAIEKYIKKHKISKKQARDDIVGILNTYNNSLFISMPN